jgi:16S rRNA (guanine527-N7)-methyltransferase
MSERPLPQVNVTPLIVPAPLSDELRGLGVSEDALPRLGLYLAHLLAMNELMNLTAIKDPAQAWRKHIYDSLTLLPLLPASDSLIDVGSGGGLPALPVAIARPQMRVTMVESTRKKADFLRTVAEQVSAANVRVEASRAEELAKSAHASAYGIVTARAVARLSQLVEWTAPFARRGGTLLFIKGQQADEEVKEASRVLDKLQIEHVRTVDTPTGRIVILQRA